MKVSYSTCPLCEANCGIEVHTQNNEIVTILGDKIDPFSQGYTCPKAFALKELHQDPDRLRHPMIREGNNWRKASWEEALDFATKGILRVQKKYGKDALGIYQGNPLGHSAIGVLFYWLLTKILKTKNIFSAASLDQLPHMIVAEELYGNLGMFTIPDIDRTDFIVVMGANPMVTNGSIMTASNIWKRFRELKDRNGKIIVIDPRKTETAKFAHQHLSIKPGTDAFLLLAFIHILFRDNLIKTNHLSSFLEGIEEIKELVKEYSPEIVSKNTSIEANIIETLVLEFTQAKSAVLYPRVGASLQEFGTLTHWLAHLINILTGNLDKAGGMMFAKPVIDFLKVSDILGEKGNFGKNKSRVNSYPSFRDEFPTAAMIDEIITPGNGQIKSMLTVAGNPVLSAPNGLALEKGLEKLEFMVAVDIYINETTRFAHVILPPEFALESVRFELVFPNLSVRNRIKYSPPVLKKDANAKSDATILKELALRTTSKWSIHYWMAKIAPLNLGLDLLIRLGTYGDRFNPFSRGLNLKKVIAEPHGIDLGPLVPMLPNRLFTKNKKIKLNSEMFIKDIERLQNSSFDLLIKSLIFNSYSFSCMFKPNCLCKFLCGVCSHCTACLFQHIASHCKTVHRLTFISFTAQNRNQFPITIS